MRKKNIQNAYAFANGFSAVVLGKPLNLAPSKYMCS